MNSEKRFPGPDGRKALRKCDGCQEKKPASNFVGELCGSCFANGVTFPDQAPPAGGASDPLTEGPMSKKGQRKQCRYCGKDVASGSLWNHEHNKCPKRLGIEGAGAGTKKRPRKRRAQQDPPAGRNDSRCLFCSRRITGLEKDLLVEAIRGGMAFDPAIALVRRIAELGIRR